MSDPAPVQKKFGTFGGVFTPNVLTILGVVMFLRCGWVVGSAGLKNAIIILCIAKAITLLTSLSLSAIATNTKTQGGGAYFLVSRSLGIEAGCSIGVPLFLAQAISVGFYIIGFTESILFIYPDVDPHKLSLIVLGVLFIIAWVGADLAIKTQYIILGCLLLSLISFFAGYDPVPGWQTTSIAPDYPEGYTFWGIFAIFFPAVTGIMAGVSMSGDLEEPNKSIPKGTLWAVAVTFVVYIVQMVWFAMNSTREELLGNNLIMRDMSAAPQLIFLGLWAASISSALASLLAAPRTLQALAKDKLLPRFIGRGYGPQKEPRLALLISGVIAAGCISLGSFNIIAPIISMFFLATYGTINITAATEHWTGNPSYRPTLKIHWAFSMVGGLACFVVMFMLDPKAAAIALLVVAIIYLYVASREYKTAWGDTRSGFWFTVTRTSLFKLASSRQHISNWRPVILILTGNPKYRQELVRFGELFEARRGLLFLGYVAVGDWNKYISKQKSMRRTLDDYIRDNQLAAVSKTVIADSFDQGAMSILQISGLGTLRPNTVLMEWKEDWVQEPAFAKTVRHILELEQNLIMHAKADLPEDELEPYIDVWWSAKENGSMMLTLAYLLQSNRGWRGYKIRLLRIIPKEAGKEEMHTHMETLLEDSRIDAMPTVIINDNKSPLDIICETSKHSISCFIGLTTKNIDQREHPLEVYSDIVNKIKGHVFLTKNWHDLEL